MVRHDSSLQIGRRRDPEARSTREQSCKFHTGSRSQSEPEAKAPGSLWKSSGKAALGQRQVPEFERNLVLAFHPGVINELGRRADRLAVSGPRRKEETGTLDLVGRGFGPVVAAGGVPVSLGVKQLHPLGQAVGPA